MSDRRQPRMEHGLTLLEVLVALVIVSFVVTLLAQMLFQVGQIERRLDETGPQAEQRAWRIALLAETIRGLQPFRPGHGQRFHGDALHMEGASLAAPFGAQASIAMFQLAIKTSEDRATSRLELVRTKPGDGDPPGPVTLLEWPGGKGNFQFLDQLGTVHDEWSKASTEDWPALPAAVLINTGMPGPVATIVLPTSLTPLSPPLLRDLERL